MDREHVQLIRSFDRTLKQFGKLAKRIESKTIKPHAHSRLFRAVIATTFVIAIAGIALPPFRIPVDGTITSGFSLRKKPEALLPISLEVHKGIDLGAPAGAKVYSTAPGVVRTVGSSETLGNYIIIRHLLGVESYYAHLSKTSVKKGDIIVFRSVRTIGAVGSSGRVTGPHLHFETRLFNVALPPRLLLVLHGMRKTIIGL